MQGTKHSISPSSTIEEINGLHSELRALVRNGLDKAIRIGQLLHECKSKLPHGEFSKWVHEHCEFTLRTAQHYMKLNDNREQLTGVAASLTDAYRILKSETVSFLSWEDVFAELRGHAERILSYKYKDPIPADLDVKGIDKFIESEIAKVDSTNTDQFEHLSRQLDKVAEMSKKYSAAFQRDIVQNFRQNFSGIPSEQKEHFLGALPLELREWLKRKKV